MDKLLEKIEETLETCGYSLDKFCELKSNNSETLRTIFEKDFVAKELTDLINSYELKPSDWKKFVHFDPNRYTRNSITNGKEGKRFGLMILGWGPDHKSPIHDHNGSHCIMRVLEGTLIETLYNQKSFRDDAWESDTSLSPEEEIEIYQKTRETELVEGETAYIHDKIGWHRVSNPSTQEPAVSLHLYAPPIEKCRTYCEIERKVRGEAKICPFYSVNGVLKLKNQIKESEAEYNSMHGL